MRWTVGTAGAGSVRHRWACCAAEPVGFGSRGKRGDLRSPKSNAVVRSPHTRRRQALMLGSHTPNRRSMNRMIEVCRHPRPGSRHQQLAARDPIRACDPISHLASFAGLHSTP
jgi:hypothetical protein